MDNNNKICLVTDFDGTISTNDFFNLVIDQLLKPNDIKPWQDYKNKLISHADALSSIFSKIRLPIDEFHKFIMQLPIEDKFIDTVEYCKSNGIPIFIVSAGADYYINYILNKLGVDDYVKVIANKSSYSQESGLTFNNDKNSEFYHSNYGIDKKKVVETLKTQYKKVIFAGDGIPDEGPASVADVVFARDILKQICAKKNIQTLDFTSYNNILDYIRNDI